MTRLPLSDFTKKVMQQIRSVPAGKVATYKQIAELADKPHGARGVSWILHSCSTAHKLPWHRILNSQGGISFDRTTHNFRKQKARLEQEGVVLTADGKLDLKIFQWKKHPAKPRRKRGQPTMFSGD